MKNTLFLCTLLAVTYSCAGQNNKGINRREESKRNDKIVSDSLKTPERRDDLNKLARVLSQNIDIKKNHLVFKLDKAQFKETGLPEAYYNRIQQEIKTNNDFIDANHIDARELLKKSDFFNNPSYSF